MRSIAPAAGISAMVTLLAAPHHGLRPAVHTAHGVTPPRRCNVRMIASGGKGWTKLWQELDSSLNGFIEDYEFPSETYAMPAMPQAVPAPELAPALRTKAAGGRPGAKSSKRRSKSKASREDMFKILDSFISEYSS